MKRLRGSELAAALGMLAGLHGTDVIAPADSARARRGKQMPHQGEREKARRLRQAKRLRCVPKGEK
jgi:hypothetical protein